MLCVLACVSLPGCVYLGDRALDLTDVLDVRFGLGLGGGAKVKATEYVGTFVGIGLYGYSVEWYGRRMRRDGGIGLGIGIMGVDGVSATGETEGKGLTIEKWNGVSRLWMEPYRKALPKAEIHTEWYRVDQVVIDYGGGDWRSGRYRILVLFQQENNPREIRGHVREYYDLNAPTKILLIWTWNAKQEPADLFGQVDEVVKFCQKNEVPTVGDIHVIVGDGQKLLAHLQQEAAPKATPEVLTSLFRTRTIPSSHCE